MLMDNREKFWGIGTRAPRPSCPPPALQSLQGRLLHHWLEVLNTFTLFNQSIYDHVIIFFWRSSPLANETSHLGMLFKMLWLSNINVFKTRNFATSTTQVQQVTTVMVAATRNAAKHGSFNRIRQVVLFDNSCIQCMARWAHASLPPPRQTASRSVQPFLQGTPIWSTRRHASTNIQTHRPRFVKTYTGRCIVLTRLLKQKAQLKNSTRT